MSKRLILSVGREFGSGGHAIAEGLAKRERIMRLYNLSPEEAEHMMSRKDWERKSYHNYYCKGKWGDSRNYDLSINSSRLGVEGTVDLLETYIRARMDA